MYRLRIVLDLRYPGIVDACEAAIRLVAPGKRVNRLLRASNYRYGTEPSDVQISAYSKSWPCLFPQHGRGKKHQRRIALAPWQKTLVEKEPELLLRGLIHSDGCRFMNTGRNWRHPRYVFDNVSSDVRRIFCEACELAGLRWTTAPNRIYVSRKADVARMDRFIGPKR